MTDSTVNIDPLTIGASSIAVKVSAGKSSGIRLVLVVTKPSRASTMAIVKELHARGKQRAFETRPDNAV